MIAIICLERGMPSNGGSSDHPDYVPAICTHRPSLLPIGCKIEVLGGCGDISSPTAELAQYFTARGSKSRNKVAVGEPAAGSLPVLLSNLRGGCHSCGKHLLGTQWKQRAPCGCKVKRTPWVKRRTACGPRNPTPEQRVATMRKAP